MVDSFPRLAARTRGFTLGDPRDFQVAPDGSRVLFLRSATGTDPLNALWSLEVATGQERLVADPGALEGESRPGHEVVDAERARRERRRERAAGIVAFAADADLDRAVFSLAGELWYVGLPAGAQRLEVAGPVFDPRLDRAGTRVAWCAGSSLWVAPTPAGPDEAARCLAGEEDPAVCWGQAEFVAAEEMGRDRGYWWAPGGEGLLAARVDVTEVATWWVADPAHPGNPPVPLRYPAAGTADASVTLWYLGLDGARVEITWNRTEYPYLVCLRWGRGAGPLLVVERRDHRGALLLEADPATGRTILLAETTDGAWVDRPAGVPDRLDDGRLVWATSSEDTHRLMVGGELVTPPGLQVRSVHAAGDRVFFRASREPSEIELWVWADAGISCLDGGGVVLSVAAGGDTVVTGRRRLAAPGLEVVVSAGARSSYIASRAERPEAVPAVRIRQLGPRRLRGAVLLPRHHRSGRRLPVLVCPYGGPGAQRVLADHHVWLEAQWRADQGFAVVVADGAGTPGRGPAWERQVHLDLATAALDDQVEALGAAAAEEPDLDLTRVRILGWSFGGYLAALAVLRRPDIFHAAVAGAPVTDWRLYDTYYTERFLGHPKDNPEAYTRSSLLDDAVNLERPLLLIHGLADDNVVVGHTLRLSQRLLEAGRSHAVLPLSGMTHMASGEQVAEALLGAQMGFLIQALGEPAPA